ncbi:glycosyltransferase family 4 protein [Geobacillus thermodenitrificans]|uniref:glycosyltransferase family 4 protein n=1 Tax=Geobacillus thermodenitrificans TaxID=33940 RepID=UPI002E22F937|nr:glycosyltransferase family 4 protein [Geobacillus thermodenitrificans]
MENTEKTEKGVLWWMKVLHLNAGNETGGGMVHILSLLQQFDRREMTLGLFERSVMYEEAQKRGLSTVCFGQTSKYDLSVLKIVADYIDREQFDIIHTHGARANLFGYLLKKWMGCRSQWVTTVHSDPRGDFIGCGWRGSIWTGLHQFALKFPDHYFAISKRFRDLLISFGIEATRITVVYNGICFEVPFCPPIRRQDIGIGENDFVLIMVARLHPVKGHILALEAVKKLVPTFPQIRLLLIGDGPLLRDLKKKVRDLELEKHVFFLGHQPYVHSFLAISDVKILSSYSESFPLVLLEAARAKLPVISTDVGGVRDLVDSPSLGWVIPVDNVSALSAAVQEAIIRKEEGTLHEMGERLYEKASKEFSIARLAADVYRTYEKLECLCSKT